MKTSLARRFGFVALLSTSPALLAAKGCSFGADDVPLGSNGEAGAGNAGGAEPSSGGTTTGDSAAGAGGADGDAGSSAGSSGTLDPPPTSTVPACLEELTPIHGTELTPLGFSANDVWQLIDGRREAAQYLIEGGRSEVEFYLVNAEIFYVESMPNPEFKQEIAISCDDHVRALGLARYAASDGSFDETLSNLALDIRLLDEGAGAIEDRLIAEGIKTMDRVELRGNYEPPSSHCFLSIQFNLSLTRAAFTGSLSETVLDVACLGTPPLTEPVISRDAGTWGCAPDVSCTRSAPHDNVVVEARSCDGLGTQITSAGDESTFVLDHDERTLTRAETWGGGCPSLPEFVLAYDPVDPVALRLCYHDGADTCEALRSAELSHDLGHAIDAAATSRYRFVD